MFFYHYKVAETHLNAFASALYEDYTANQCTKVATCGSNRIVYKKWIKKESAWCYFMIQTDVHPIVLSDSDRKAFRALTTLYAKRGLTKEQLSRYAELKAKSNVAKQHKKQNPAVLGFCSMDKIPRWVGLETTMLYVNPDCRGQGIATTLYDAIMRDGVIVISGYSHNKKSRRLWMSLIQNPSYVTWAHDIVNLDQYAGIAIDDDGKFECALKLYEDIKKIRRRRKHDVRIIAFNPRYV